MGAKLKWSGLIGYLPFPREQCAIAQSTSSASHRLPSQPCAESGSFVLAGTVHVEKRNVARAVENARFCIGFQTVGKKNGGQRFPSLVVPLQLPVWQKMIANKTLTFILTTADLLWKKWLAFSRADADTLCSPFSRNYSQERKISPNKERHASKPDARAWSRLQLCMQSRLKGEWTIAP